MISVNSENLLPISQKYNTGSLRVPADPSWPKIPHRKLANNSDDNKLPFVTNTTNSTMQNITAQAAEHKHRWNELKVNKSGTSLSRSFRIDSPASSLRRQPSLIDPRFRRVAMTKNQIKSTSPPEAKTDNLKEVNNSVPVSPKQANMCHKATEQNLIPEDKSNSQDTQAKKSDKIENYGNINSQPLNNIYLENFEDLKSKDSSEPKELLTTGEQSFDTQITQKENDILKTKDSATSCNLMPDSKPETNLCVQSNDISHPVTQENNRPIFLLIEPKVQSLSSTAQTDVISSSQKQKDLQCYNMQVPVLTYQSIPIQISTESQEKIEMPSQIRQISLSSITTITESKVQDKNSQQVPAEQDKHIFLSTEQNALTNEKNEVIRLCNKNIPVSNSQAEDNTIFHTKEIPQDVNNINNQHLLHTDPNTIEKLDRKNVSQIESKTKDPKFDRADKKNHQTCQNTSQCVEINKNMYSFYSESTDTESYSKELEKKCNKCDTIDDKLRIQISVLDKPHVHWKRISTPMYKIKSEQNVACKESQYVQQNQTQTSEPHIAIKQRKTENFTKKAKSYLQKNSRSIIAGSDCTLIWPGHRSAKRRYNRRFLKPSESIRRKIYQNVKSEISKINKDLDTDRFSTEASSLKKNLCINSCKNETDLNLSSDTAENIKQTTAVETSDANDTIKKTAISLKTQQLLNKSYWEYYDKLRHKAKEKENLHEKYLPQQSEDPCTIKMKKNFQWKDISNAYLKDNPPSPEMQTLEQCTILSSVINKTLDSNITESTDVTQGNQLYLNSNVKSTSDPVIHSQNAKKIAMKSNKQRIYNSTILSPFVNKVKDKKDVDKRLLKLKTIVFLASVIYTLIIFLPMIYDYFLYEEYDDYENMSYAEFILDYGMSSFKEAFGSFYQAFTKIFFQPIHSFSLHFLFFICVLAWINGIVKKLSCPNCN